MFLISSPFAVESDGSIVAPKVGTHRLFESAPKEHGGASVFLLPAVQVSMAIAPGTGEEMADLGVAVDHEATLPTKRSSQRLHRSKPSSEKREVPFTTVRVTLTTPESPTKCLSSISFRASSSVS